MSQEHIAASVATLQHRLGPAPAIAVLLAGFIGNAVAPAALGRPYVKER